ncbi:MAG TPA: LacI family DNA-binding transcriptional regulator [Acidobacteriaceae bacterium]|jgi:LacI family transcriptional regulator
MDRDQRAVARSTIRDVSRLAEVSIKTVSRVINNEKYVTQETRARVEAAMSRLGFQPSFAARALAGHRSHQIAVICDNPNPWYVYEVLYGTRSRCQRDGIRVIAQPYDRASPALLDDVTSLVDQVHPDGLVLTPPGCDDIRVLNELARRKVPMVRIQPGIFPEMTASVQIDNVQAAYDMTRHLLDLGHRRIGFIVGDRAYAVSEQRLNGYMRALGDAGQRVEMELIQQGTYEFGSGAKAAEQLLKSGEPPTAIFASNDEMAAGVLSTAHRLNISVPKQLSVAGFDDAAFAQLVWPPLTSVRQPVRLLAEEAAGLLLTKPGVNQSIKIAYELVTRESTAKA